MRWRRALAVLAAGAALVAGCGDDDDKADALDALGGGDIPDADGGSTVPELGGDGGGDAPDLPDDICTLLSEDEVGELVPGARTESSGNMEAGGVASGSCAWINDMVTLNVTLNAGIPDAQLALAIDIGVDDHDGESIEVAGDDAGVWSVTPGSLEVVVLHDGILVTLSMITLEGDGAVRRDTMVGLAEAAVVRL